MKKILNSFIVSLLIVFIGCSSANDSLNNLEKKAEQGDANAQSKLGYMYLEGKGVPKDLQEAAKWYRKSAEQGDANAQCNLGYMYDQGEGVPKDFQEATKWYWKAAEQGYAVAQCNLGNMYYQGEGVPKDFQEATKWYRKAAEQGYANAQFNLGLMYYGFGVPKVPKDLQETIKWYRKAAEQGNVRAQFNLGDMYSRGEGVPKDNVLAYMWLNLASSQGDKASEMVRDWVVVKKMTSEQIAEAQKLSREWKIKK